MFHEALQPNEGTQFPTIAEMRGRALELLRERPYDSLIAYEEFAQAIGVNPMTDRRGRSAVLKAGRDLLAAHNKKIINVREQGYRIIRPNEHAVVSQSEQRRARRLFKQSLQTVTHVALDHLTPTEIAQVMMEQARSALQVAMAKRLSRAKALPPRCELKLPSTSKLVEMMRKKTG